MKSTVIVDLIAAQCEVSRKNGECFVIRTDDGAESFVAPAELLKMIRYAKRQEEKSGATKPVQK